jgi:AbrB family looped-hinge helix DNA binding protein
MTATTFKEVRVHAQGRVVIPAELRQAMQLHEGEQLIARVEDGRLILERREDVRRRLMTLFPPTSPSPVDELLAERRAETSRE